MSTKPTCVQCAFWTCAFYNSCCHPQSPRFEQYVSGEEKACEHFEQETL